MLRSFVDDSYLERYYGDIINYKKGGQVDYSNVISLATEVLLDDLVNRDIDPRLVMVPIDLNRESDSTSIQKLISETLTDTDNGYAWEAGSQRRFVVNLATKSVSGDDWSFILQGSNKLERPDANDSSWETVATIQYDANTAASEENATFTTLYKWYRRRVVKTSGSGSVTFTCSVWETIFDSMIAYKTLEIIAQSWKTGLNAKWDDMKVDMAKEYDSKMQSIKFTYDNDEDGVPELSEPKNKTNVKFIR